MMRSLHGILSAVSAWIAAKISARWFVQRSSSTTPLSRFSWAPERSTTPQPPRPGLGKHAPSMWALTVGCDVGVRGLKIRYDIRFLRLLLAAFGGSDPCRSARRDIGV